jgi:uncharacterized sulfatase
LAIVGLTLMVRPVGAAVPSQPNILWLVAEDINPHLGCYGDAYAVTPNLDRFAARSVRYTTAWSSAPVCAPARTALISGVFPPSTGSEHMRSLTSMPTSMKMYPQFLREAGYYCVNNAKEDYNLIKPPKLWDASSRSAHYTNRAPGQPFMAVFNHEITHESQIRNPIGALKHDPARAYLPAYHPDTPEVRHDWAQYYDRITAMDQQIGAKLQALEREGLADDTIVFFYGDNGSGMPRSKRWPYNSGLHVPLLIHIPGKFRHLAPADYRPGSQTDRLVSFLDFPPTLLSLAGIKPPPWMQGRAFLGPFATPDPQYLYGFRGRMDERYDLVRSVRDPRYLYIRNFMPHKIYGQHINYMFETPTTRVWKQLYDEHKLNPIQSRFWEAKPPEELYDLRADHDEVNNLAGSPEHRADLVRLRSALDQWLASVRDTGFLPEDEIHARSAESTPYDMGHDDGRYPFARVYAMACRASSLQMEAVPDLKKGLADSDSAVRYWAALGLLMRGAPAVKEARPDLVRALQDPTPSVRIVAAEALGKHGTEAEKRRAVTILGQLAPRPQNDPYVSLQALNALDELGDQARAVLPQIKAATTQGGGRAGGYSTRMVETITAKLESAKPRSE